MFSPARIYLAQENVSTGLLHEILLHEISPAGQGGYLGQNTLWTKLLYPYLVFDIKNGVLDVTDQKMWHVGREALCIRTLRVLHQPGIAGATNTLGTLKETCTARATHFFGFCQYMFGIEDRESNNRHSTPSQQSRVYPSRGLVSALYSELLLAKN